MRNLAEYFYKYLLSNPESNHLDILLTGQTLSLDQIDSNGLDLYRESLGSFPDVYHPGEAHGPTINWLSERKIRTLWYKTPHTRQALSILDNNRLRDTIEALILMPIPLCDSIEDLNLDVSLEAVHIYKHFFFNIDLLNAGELMMKVEHNPRHRMALEVHPEAEVALAVMQHVYGTSPSDMSGGKAAKLAIGSVAAKLLTCARSPSSSNDALTMSRYVTTLQRAQEVVLGGDLAAESLIDLLNSIQVKRETVITPTYKELTGNEYVPDEEE